MRSGNKYKYVGYLFSPCPRRCLRYCHYLTLCISCVISFLFLDFFFYFTSLIVRLPMYTMLLSHKELWCENDWMRHCWLWTFFPSTTIESHTLCVHNIFTVIWSLWRSYKPNQKLYSAGCCTQEKKNSFTYKQFCFCFCLQQFWSHDFDERWKSNKKDSVEGDEDDEEFFYFILSNTLSTTRIDTTTVVQ